MPEKSIYFTVTLSPPTKQMDRQVINNNFYFGVQSLPERRLDDDLEDESVRDSDSDYVPEDDIYFPERPSDIESTDDEDEIVLPIPLN